MALDSSDSTAIEHKSQLVEWMAQGAKPREQWRIGTEHEKFVFHQSSRQPASYDEKNGISALLCLLADELRWNKVVQDGALIGLTDPKSGAGISLEPGGQFELSGAPVQDLHDMSKELDQHLLDVKTIGEKLGLSFLGLGFLPQSGRADMPRMPKRRYEIMTAYMPKVGTMGLDMMYRTATVQVNLDYCSEPQMVQMFRVSLALQPIITALMAASPFSEGKPNGFQSMRSEIWRNTDNDRSGMIPFVFENGMGFERYADWAIDVPMYFIKRGDQYIDVSGIPFRTLLEGKVPGHSDLRATLSDWTNHLGTLFPEVRLKRFLEMRGADSGPQSHIKALSSFWTGLLYEKSAMDEALQLIKGWAPADILALRDNVPRLGLKAEFMGRSVRDVARDAVAIADKGLCARKRRAFGGVTEEIYLTPLHDIVESGKTLSDVLLENYKGPWKGSVVPVYKALAL